MKVVKIFAPDKEKELNKFLVKHQEIIPYSSISIAKDFITVTLETDQRTATRLSAGESTYNDFYRQWLIHTSALGFWKRLKVKKEIDGQPKGTDIKDYENELKDIDRNIIEKQFELQMCQEQMDDIDRELAEVRFKAKDTAKNWLEDNKDI